VRGGPAVLDAVREALRKAGVARGDFEARGAVAKDTAAAAAGHAWAITPRVEWQVVSAALAACGQPVATGSPWPRPPITCAPRCAVAVAVPSRAPPSRCWS